MHALQLGIHISFIDLPLNQWAFGTEFWQKGQYILVMFAVVSALPGRIFISNLFCLLFVWRDRKASLNYFISNIKDIFSHYLPFFFFTPGNTLFMSCMRIELLNS